MKLNVTEIAGAARGRLISGSSEGVITEVIIDSRSAGAGSLFIPLTGAHADGHAFIEDAFKNSACASLVQKGHAVISPLARTYPGRVLIEVSDPLRALGDIERVGSHVCDQPVFVKSLRNAHRPRRRKTTDAGCRLLDRTGDERCTRSALNFFFDDARHMQ